MQAGVSRTIFALLINGWALLACAVPPPIPIGKLVADADWVVVGTLGELRPVSGRESSWVRHGQIAVREVLKSPPGAKTPRKLTLFTLDPKSRRVGPIMYRAGTTGIWILQTREPGIFSARNSNSLQPLDKRAAVIKAIEATPKTLVVSADGTGDCRTLSVAIERARPEATIHVRPGIYREAVKVHKPLKIVGDGPRHAIIVQASDGDGLFIDADHALIKGITFRCRAGAKQEFFAVDIAAGAVAIKDCDLSSNSLACLGIHGSATRPRVADCWLHDGADAGVIFYDAAHGELIDCQIFGNTEAGVVVLDKSAPELVRCSIHHGKAAGVRADAGSGGMLRWCDVFANAGPELDLADGAGTMIKECHVARDPLSIDTVTTNVDDTDEDVDPALTELQFHFAQSMDTHAQYITRVADDDEHEFPVVDGEKSASFRDDRTLMVKVTLRPNTRYAIGLNDEEHLDFQSAAGVPLEPMILTFRTGAKRTRGQSTVRKAPAKPTMLFLEFMRDPTREKYLAVRAAVIGDESYSPYSSDLDKAGTLLNEKKAAEAKALLTRAMPNLLLSPRAHWYEALAHKMMGHDKEMQFAARCGNFALRGIQLTGDGTAEKPYLVLRVSDEYDLLKVLKIEHSGQGLIRKNGRAYDVFTGKDGAKTWFDVTDAFHRQH